MGAAQLLHDLLEFYGNLFDPRQQIIAYSPGTGKIHFVNRSDANYPSNDGLLIIEQLQTSAGVCRRQASAAAREGEPNLPPLPPANLWLATVVPFLQKCLRWIRGTEAWPQRQADLFNINPDGTPKQKGGKRKRVQGSSAADSPASSNTTPSSGMPPPPPPVPPQASSSTQPPMPLQHSTEDVPRHRSLSVHIETPLPRDPSPVPSTAFSSLGSSDSPSGERPAWRSLGSSDSPSGERPAWRSLATNFDPQHEIGPEGRSFHPYQSVFMVPSDDERSKRSRHVATPDDVDERSDGAFR